MSIKRSKRLLISAVLPFLVSCTGSAQTNFAHPVEFSNKSICQEIDRKAPKAIPETVLSTLEEESEGNDGYQIAEAMLIAASINVAHASETADTCQRIFSRGEEKFYPVLASKQSSFQDLGSSRLYRNKDIRAVQSEITILWREDQSARGVYVGLQTGDEAGASYWAERLAAAHTTRIDETSKRYIEKTIKSYDWIDRKRFGKTVSNHAWLLVQHADDDPIFQTKVLKRMEPYLKTRGVDRANYAYLWDRVAVNTGQKQRYGTQPDWNCINGEMQLQPLEDPQNVSHRRKEMNLGHVEADLQKMNFQTCGVPDN